MKSRVVVVAIIEKNGKILMGQKTKDVGPYPNTWHLPGGGVNLENESLEEAVKREIKEETGLELKNLERVSFDEDNEPDKHGIMTHYVFLVFHAEPIGEYVASDDLKQLRWVDKSELQDLPLTRPSIKYFREIRWL